MNTPNTVKPIAYSKPSALKRRKRIAEFMFAVPALIFLIVFVYYPIIDLFRISFTDWNAVKKDFNVVGLKNYRWLFAGTGAKKLVSSLKTTFIFTIGELACGLFGGMMLSLLFNRMSRGFNMMRGLLVLPKYIATSSSAVVFVWMMNSKQGVLTYAVNNLINRVGDIRWLNSMPLAMISLIIFTAWYAMGYAMIIYLSAMRGISQDYYEAAALDGANAVQRFTRITVPMLSPTILFLGVTSFINSMKVYQSVDVLTEGGPYNMTNVVVYWIYDLAFRSFRMDRAAAVGCVFFVILMVITVSTMKWSNNKVNYDA